jgi:hypothetical protein
MAGALNHLSNTRLRAKQTAYWLRYLQGKEAQIGLGMANDDQNELDFDAGIEGESKLERFKRVVNPRLALAIKRMRMIRQMFEGATVNNYEFTDEQRARLVQSLRDEVEAIDKLMSKRLRNRDDDIPQL